MQISTSSTLGIIIQERKLGLIAWLEDGLELAQRWHTLDNGEIDKLIIFKPLHLAKLINTFIQCFSRQEHIPCIITLDGPELRQEVHLEKPHALTGGYAWNSYPLGKYWYSAGIPFWLRMQYHLLALRLPIKLIDITSLTAAYTALHRENEFFKESSVNLQQTLDILQETLIKNIPYSKALSTLTSVSI